MSSILTSRDQNIIVNDEAYGDISDKYIATSTESLLEEIGKYKNLKPIDFKAANVRKEEKEGKQKHAIMLQGDNSDLGDGTNLRVVLFNSSDRSSSIKLYIGAYRAICENGMVFGDDIMEPVSIRHTKKDWKYSIFQLMQEYDSIQKTTQDMVNSLMNRYLSYSDIGKLSERVVEEFDKDITGSILDPLQFNTAHRKEDVGKSAWLTYQRMQYNLLQGGVDRIIEKQDDETQDIITTISKTHKITDHKKSIDMNRRLHDLIMGTL